ncbi:MAG: prolyl oligopeptidase family serine peptidase [Actinobacteria bacterium]|nr:prolyl oligopeptidase family serine peptidase [Actinomycetota bacterium]
MAPDIDPLDGFPRQLARTRRFTLGVPRSFTVSPDGERVVFLRSAGDDPVSGLWVFDVGSGVERLVFGPEIEEAEGELTEAERARRERAREQSSGVTAHATDKAARRAVFTVAGRMYLADLVEGSARELATPGSVDDPRLDPTGERIAFVVAGDLHVREIEGGERTLAAADEPDTFWGLAEFAAAEEMERRRGHWWSPDGTKLAATHVDERDVRTWYIGDPTDPAAEPRSVRYPQAGTANAVVTLWIFDVAGVERREIRWDHDAFPYLARVSWDEGGPLTLLVQTRDQRTVRLLEADVDTGETALVSEQTDPEWTDLPDQAPTRLSDGRIVTIVADREADTYRLTVGTEPVTPPGLQVRTVVSADEGVLFRASEGDPTQIHLWRWTPGDGNARLSTTEGVHTGVEGGEVLVLTSATANEPLSTTTVLRKGEPVAEIENRSERPVVDARPMFLTLGERELRAALLLPNGREPEAPLPVLMDPYGFPHGARVLKAAGAHVTSQWFADQGFAVLVVDGRGVDGRGPAWDREMRFDFTIAVEDQADALHAAAERFPFLDLSRVGIRGWSGGGYLSAMAVLRRPDVFHAGVVGAPVTDVRLYDTHYMERYLGDPNEHPDVYERNSFVADAPNLERPMLLIHGLADDNVFVANTLRLSAALFEAGRHHELVLIPNATHLTRSTAVTENVLRVQFDFLRRSLAR